MFGMNENVARDLSVFPPADDVDPNETIESRLCRLERAIAALQDTRLIEQRLLDRVTQRLEAIPPRADDREGTGSSPSTSWIPGALRLVGQQFMAATRPEAEPPRASFFSAKSWILTDLIQEVRTFVMLYFDYRYRPSLPARVIPPAAICIFLFSWIGLRNFVFATFVGAMIDYTINLFMVVLVYKTLQREAARYKSMVSQFPPL
jgi:hypothetical protein